MKNKVDVNMTIVAEEAEEDDVEKVKKAPNKFTDEEIMKQVTKTMLD